MAGSQLEAVSAEVFTSRITSRGTSKSLEQCAKASKLLGYVRRNTSPSKALRLDARHTLVRYTKIPSWLCQASLDFVVNRSYSKARGVSRGALQSISWIYVPFICDQTKRNRRLITHLLLARVFRHEFLFQS